MRRLKERGASSPIVPSLWGGDAHYQGMSEKCKLPLIALKGSVWCRVF
jgi:hypothetical protein